MTLALVRVPHRKPAWIDWYKTRYELIIAATLYADGMDRNRPEDFDEAVACLTDDDHSHTLVESATDVDELARCTGHQRYRIVGLLAELREVFI